MTTLNTIVAIPVYSMPVDDARAQSVSLVQIVTNADTYIHINNCIVLGISPAYFLGNPLLMKMASLQSYITRRTSCL